MKSILSLLALVALFGLASCKSSQSADATGKAGDAYREVDNISTLYIMPIEVPREIHGNASDEEKNRWRDDWPMVGARLIARGAADEAGDKMSCSALEKKPETGYYFVLKITHVDVGDSDVRSSSLLASDEKGWSHVLATGRIVRAETGDTVAELTFDQSSGHLTKEPFQNDMANLGQELAVWILSRR